MPIDRLKTSSVLLACQIQIFKLIECDELSKFIFLRRSKFLLRRFHAQNSMQRLLNSFSSWHNKNNHVLFSIVVFSLFACRRLRYGWWYWWQSTGLRASVDLLMPRDGSIRPPGLDMPSLSLLPDSSITYQGEVNRASTDVVASDVLAVQTVTFWRHILRSYHSIEKASSATVMLHAIHKRRQPLHMHVAHIIRNSLILAVRPERMWNTPIYKHVNWGAYPENINFKLAIRTKWVQTVETLLCPNASGTQSIT